MLSFSIPTLECKMQKYYLLCFVAFLQIFGFYHIGKMKKNLIENSCNQIQTSGHVSVAFFLLKYGTVGLFCRIVGI